MIQWFVRWAAVAIGLLAMAASPALGQHAQFRTVEDGPQGQVLEVTIAWPTSLAAAFDSTGVTQLDEHAVVAVTRGVLTTSQTLRLPALAMPQFRVVASDFDEVSLPAGDASDALLAEMDREPVAVLGLGLERKEPAATLAVRLVTYDSERQVMRRYRRLVVDVVYGTASKMAGRVAVQGGAADNPHLDVAQSALADGTVFKVPFTGGEEGIFRIDRVLLTGLLGQEAQSIDPDRIRVYGNGGAPVPALNSAPRLADLVENPVFVRGGGDGSFDDGDAVFFYAKGPQGWRAAPQFDLRGDTLRDASGNVVYQWEHYVHPFSNENYYFIKIAGASGARVGEVSYPGFPGATRLTQVEGRHFRDIDEFLWARETEGTGHTWVSNLIELGGGSLVAFENQALPGFLGGTVQYEARAAIQSNPAASVYFRSGNTQLAEASFGPTNNDPTNIIAASGIARFEQEVSAGQAINLTMQLQNRSGSPKAALDWVRVYYPKALSAADGTVRFHTPLNQVGAFEFVLSGFSQPPQVWDVTEPGAIQRLAVQPDGGSYRVQLEVADRTAPRELIAFSEAAVQSLSAERCPGGEGSGCRVAAQNLHGISTYPDFVIVTPAAFATYAEELAAMRRAEGLVTEVVNVQQIYNEFSGGLQDPRGLRDYFKFLYDRAPDASNLLRYVLFYGDGHFNYRELGEEPALTNWIVPYETEESFDPEHSYTSDDYFGLLDDDEGLWPFQRRIWTGSNAHLNERVDLGIGRLTVQTEDEAATVLDKIKLYESGSTLDAWRSRYLFIADDAYTGRSGQTPERDLHVQNTDVVAELVQEVAPEVNQKKVYGISYERVRVPSGWRLPGAKQDILTAIREGVLLFNYSGHGGEEGLAQEEIFTEEDAHSLTNKDRLPIFITATCSFGRWDMGNDQSGAEALLLNPNGGAIALLTTVRTVYTTGFNFNTLNVGLNYELNRQLFIRDEDGLPRRLGDALRETKNTQVGYEGNNRKFNLLGDPTMRLGLPAFQAAVETVNGVALSEQTAQLRALDQVTIEGQIQRPDGTFDPSFNGSVNVAVFDALRHVTIEEVQYLDRSYYRVREDLLWRGKVQVSNGRFTATFVVPKDISYSNEPGRISVYASSTSNQALGFTENVRVGGTSENPRDDAQGPEIELFLNDEGFVNGGVTPAQPRLLVKLFDESGINTVGAGVGHEMLLVLDGDEQNAIEIGDLYEAEENSFQRGTVTFEFEEPLEAGPHTLSVRAWDVANNSTTTTLDFIVSDAETLALKNVFNYPNPTTGPTRFVFEHNQPVGTPASIQVRIYTLSGMPVRTIEREEILPGGSLPIEWDGRDEDQDQLGSGIYLYKVRVEVDGPEGERQVSEQIEKLAIIR